MVDMITTILATLGVLYLISPVVRADINSTIASLKNLIPTKKQ